jgi:hypothetical protein
MRRCGGADPSRESTSLLGRLGVRRGLLADEPGHPQKVGQDDGDTRCACKFGFIVLSYAAGTHGAAENHHRNGLSEERKDERLQSIFRCCGGWCFGHYASFCRRGVGKKGARSGPDVTASPAAPRSAGAPAEQLSRRGFKGLRSGIVPLPVNRAELDPIVRST